MVNRFTANVKIFEREKGWYYISVPTELSKPLEHIADRGLISINATVGNSNWQTSLLPMGDGTHFIALPAKVRSKEKLSLGTEVEISFETRTRNSNMKIIQAAGKLDFSVVKNKEDKSVFLIIKERKITDPCG